MSTYHVNPHDPAVRYMRAAFPSYSGRMFKIRSADTVNVRSYWDGGSRDYFAFVNLATGVASGQVPAQSAFDRPIAGAESVALPPGFACVEHTIFCGKDLGLTLIVRPDAIAPLLPAPADLTDVEAKVLATTCRLKNSYGGESDIRRKRAGVPVPEWIAAQDAMKKRGYLNRAGSITPDGRNAIEGHPYRSKSW